MGLRSRSHMVKLGSVSGEHKHLKREQTWQTSDEEETRGEKDRVDHTIGEEEVL